MTATFLGGDIYKFAVQRGILDLHSEHSEALWYKWRTDFLSFFLAICHIWQSAVLFFLVRSTFFYPVSDMVYYKLLHLLCHTSQMRVHMLTVIVWDVNSSSNQFESFFSPITTQLQHLVVVIYKYLRNACFCSLHNFMSASISVLQFLLSSEKYVVLVCLFVCFRFVFGLFWGFFFFWLIIFQYYARYEEMENREIAVTVHKLI